MPSWLQALRNWVARPAVQRLQARIDRLERALAITKSRNEELARALELQRQKTRELYGKTKEYAERLNSLR